MYRYGTSCTITSAPQFGKSKGAQYFIREHATNRAPFGLIDFHGPLYDDVLSYLAYARPKMPVYLLNLSDPFLINPFNPFEFKGGDMNAHASRHAETIIKAWGAENSNDLPTYRRITKAVVYLSAATGEPLHHVATLLERPEHELREWAISVLDDRRMKNQWKELQDFSASKNPGLWKGEVVAAYNRLQPFTDSAAARLFTGFPSVIDIDRIWSEGGCLLVRAAPSLFLSEESAKVFCSLLQSEFLHSARMHMNEERPFFLYMDEVQQYATSDTISLINETPKTGLRITSIFHHAGEFHEKPHIAESLNMGSQIKIAQ